MRWERRSRRGDVIDARGGGMRPRGGLPMGRAGVGGGIGIVGLIVFILISSLGGGGGVPGLGVDSGFPSEAPGAPDAQGIPAAQDPERDLRDFSAYVFSDAQDTWSATFKRSGRTYDRAQLVLYRDAVSTGCGNASSAVGPFYCPADQRVYLDLSFFGDMERQLGAPGDFAWAYVIAHEVGHHVQDQLGTSNEVRRLQSENPDHANGLSVRLELQADCYAGVWANTVYEAGDLQQGDIEEAITASESVGDDRLQSRAGGSVNPDSFTHGSSEQRARWFNEGRAAGEPGSCDTFAVDEP
jgi:predicted metalloprotease